MLGFRTLADLIDYIRDESMANGYMWNNDAGDWDIGDINVSSGMYDDVYNFYYLDLGNYNIHDEKLNILFGRIR